MASGRWASSTRRSRLPKNWPAIQRRILARDTLCQVCHHNRAAQADHITPGDNHTDANLQGICVPCHKTKTATEAVAAQPRQHRPPEPHPGLIEEATP